MAIVMVPCPDDAMERAHGHPDAFVCGVDEVGRGPLAGPVVAAAVIMPADGLEPDLTGRIRDSKLLSAEVREELALRITATCITAVAEADVGEIDSLNILHASMLAMSRAIAALASPPVSALIDGNRCPPDLPCRSEAVVKGDARCLSIAAASIIAKVHRDAFMRRLADSFPGYGWETNAGYGTPHHKRALRELGPTPFHRRSFAPVYELLTVTG